MTNAVAHETACDGDIPYHERTEDFVARCAIDHLVVFHEDQIVIVKFDLVEDAPLGTDEKKLFFLEIGERDHTQVLPRKRAIDTLGTACTGVLAHGGHVEGAHIGKHSFKLRFFRFVRYGYLIALVVFERM